MISKANGDPDAMFNVATQYLQGAAGEVDVQKALTHVGVSGRGRAQRTDGMVISWWFNGDLINDTNGNLMVI